MDNLEKIFKITRERKLKTFLGVDYKCGVRDDGKDFCKAIMVKKVKEMVEQHEWHIGGEAETRSSPGKLHEHLETNEGESVDAETYRYLVG